MTDPMAEIVTLLQPGALLAKVATGAGAWQVRRPATDQPFYCVLLEGRSHLEIEGHRPIDLVQGDFVFAPATPAFVMSGGSASADGPVSDVVTLLPGEVRHGDPAAAPDARLLIGHFRFGSPDAALLLALLPRLVCIRGEQRLSTLVQMVADEARQMRPGRDVVLEHLLQVLLIEAFRAGPDTPAPPGLLSGLSDPRLSVAIRAMHAAPERAWSVAALAREASLSRSAFFERFQRALGLAPMEYLLSWRMALARRMLRRREGTVAEIAARVGYGSASSFTVAFVRAVGVTPGHYARAETPRLTD